MNRFVATAGLALAISSGLAQLAPGAVGSAAHLRLAGSLDPSFGSGGVVKGSGERINAIALEPDGRIFVLESGSLARYLPDGSVDPSFARGSNGATDFYGAALGVQPDGKIVVAGVGKPVSAGIDSEFAVARYNPDGTSDSSFGTDGVVKTVIPGAPITCGDASWSAGANALAILPGGDIVAAGSAGGEVGCATLDGYSSFALVRYTSDGSLDPTFGNGGIVQTSFDGDDDLSGIAVQPDGKIVATGSAGFVHGEGTSAMALARYEPDGSLDPDFGIDGKATTDPKLSYLVGGPPTLRNGKILVAGSTSSDGRPPWFPVLARYDANGDVDSTFGRHGLAEIRRNLGEPTAMLRQSDGKTLIAESSSRQGPSIVVRFLPNGRLDGSFGRGGIVSLGDATWSLATQPDRKILVGRGDGSSWALARLNGGNNCVVPRVGGKTVAGATSALRTSYCRRGRITRRFSAGVTRGRVISTAPRLGARLPGGSNVDLVVSKGRRP